MLCPDQLNELDDLMPVPLSESSVRNVGTGLDVGVAVGRRVGVGTGVGEGVCVGTAVGLGVGVTAGVAVGALVAATVGVAATAMLAAGLVTAAIPVVEVAPGSGDGVSVRPMYSIDARYKTANTIDAPMPTRRSAWTRTIFPRSQ